jgi:hypothetical protein
MPICSLQLAGMRRKRTGLITAKTVAADWPVYAGNEVA